MVSFQKCLKVLGIFFLEGQVFIPGTCLQVNPPVTNGLRVKSKQYLLPYRKNYAEKTIKENKQGQAKTLNPVK